jgi:hypothetical protein
VLPAIVSQYRLDALFGFSVIGAVKINGALQVAPLIQNVDAIMRHSAGLDLSIQIAPDLAVSVKDFRLFCYHARYATAAHDVRAFHAEDNAIKGDENRRPPDCMRWAISHRQAATSDVKEMFQQMRDYA